MGGVRSRIGLLGQKQKNKELDSQNVCEVTIENLDSPSSLLRIISPLEPWVWVGAGLLGPTVPNPLSIVFVLFLFYNPLGRIRDSLSHRHLWNSNHWRMSKIF